MEVCLVVFACLIALALAASVRAGYLAGRRKRLAAGRGGEERVGVLLDLAGGEDRLDGIVFGKTLKRSAQVDHLVRGERCLVVVETKNWNGVVDGGADDESWTLKRRDGTSAPLRNPLRQARRQAHIVAEAAMPDVVAVRHLVVMAGRARHASGRFPPGVVAARDLRCALPEILGQGGDPEIVEQAWRRLVDQAFEPGAERRADRYVEWLEERFGSKPWRSWLVVALSLAAVAWTMALCLTALRMRGEGKLF